jgi:hypothetical protein
MKRVAISVAGFLALVCSFVCPGAATAATSSVTIRSAAQARTVANNIVGWVQANDKKATRLLSIENLSLLREATKGLQKARVCNRPAQSTEYWCLVGSVPNEMLSIELVFAPTGTPNQFSVRVHEETTS